MKKIYFLLLGLLPFFVSGQSLTVSDLPSIGTAWILGNDSTYVQPIPAGGTNQTWNYSSLQNLLSDTLGFINPATTPYSGSFSGSNLAGVDLATTTYSYFTGNSSGLYIDGIANATSTIAYNPHRLYFPVPFSYGNTRSTYSRIQVDTVYSGNNVRVIIRVNSTFEADGTGNLILPSGTYNSVLRIKETALEYDSILANVGGFYIPLSSTVSQTTAFNFMHPANPIVLIMTLDGDSLGQNATASRYYTGVSINGISTTEKEKGVLAYPNPSNNFINLNLSNFASDHSIEIYDATGRLVSILQGEDNINGRINTDKFENGNYFFNIKSATRIASGSFIVQH